MNATTTIKRLYRATTSVVFFVIVLTFCTLKFGGVYNRVFFYWDIGIYGAIFTLATAIYCWIMTHKNWETIWKWLASAIPIMLLLLQFAGVKMLTTIARNNQEFININVLNQIFFGVLIIYIAVITFYSKTKLPIQTKIGTHIFKWLSIVAQIALWICFIMILPTFISYWIEWWPTEEWVHDAINQMNAEFDNYF